MRRFLVNLLLVALVSAANGAAVTLWVQSREPAVMAAASTWT